MSAQSYERRFLQVPERSCSEWALFDFTKGQDPPTTPLWWPETQCHLEVVSDQILRRADATLSSQTSLAATILLDPTSPGNQFASGDGPTGVTYSGQVPLGPIFFYLGQAYLGQPLFWPDLSTKKSVFV